MTQCIYFYLIGLKEKLNFTYIEYFLLTRYGEKASVNEVFATEK